MALARVLFSLRNTDSRISKVCALQLHLQCGLKSVGMVFLMSDAQIADERFLVLINDLLASGEIPDLFADDEIENIMSAMRNVVKGNIAIYLQLNHVLYLFTCSVHP